MPFHPARFATVLSDWPQHLVSARKIRSGLALMITSADSCGNALSSVTAASAMLTSPTPASSEPMNVLEVIE